MRLASKRRTTPKKSWCFSFKGTEWNENEKWEVEGLKIGIVFSKRKTKTVPLVFSFLSHAVVNTCYLQSWHSIPLENSRISFVWRVGRGLRYRRPFSFIYAILCFHSLIIIIMLFVPVEFVIAELSWIDFSYIPVSLHDSLIPAFMDRRERWRSDNLDIDLRLTSVISEASKVSTSFFQITSPRFFKGGSSVHPWHILPPAHGVSLFS